MLLKEIFPIKGRTYKDDRHRWNEYFGIELELEGVGNPAHLESWSIKEDGSLRDGMEYVLRSPSGGKELVTALDEYYGAGLKYRDSERASTHIHINMTQDSVETLRSMVVIMYMLEGPLFAMVGESRKWAGYSMALSEMEPSRMINLLQSDKPTYIAHAVNTGRNTDRYYGFNVAAIRKYGTVEFRYYPGSPSREELETWLDLALSVKKAALEFSVQQMIDMVNSEQDLVAFIQRIFPAGLARKLLAAANMEEVMNAFNTVATMATPDTEVTARREPLVFLKGAVLKFAKKRLKEDPAKQYLDDIATKLQVVTGSEWKYHLSQAQRLTKGGKIERIDDWGADYYDPPEPALVNREYEDVVARAQRQIRERARAQQQQLDLERQMRANVNPFQDLARPVVNDDDDNL